MFVRKICVILLTITLGVCQEPVKCPDNKLLEPCYCRNEYKGKLSLQCGSSAITDLAPIFANMKNLPQNQKSFECLAVRGTNIARINANTFGDITFKFISIISDHSLKVIDVNAFKGLNSLVSLTISNISKLDYNSNTGTDLFGVIRNIPNISYIWVNNIRLTQIRKNSFNGLTEWKERR